MGCDGGTIPKRDELVRTKKKKPQCSKEITNAAKWNHCRLSQQALQKPIVADLLGNIYNKECIIEHLLDRSKYENGPEHVKSLKDVKELNMVSNPSFDANKQEKGDEFSTLNRSQWICPITGLEMNGTFKFFFLYSCGCAFSERAFKTIQPANKKCIKCEKSFSDTDLIIINPNDEELELNKEKLKQRKESAAKAKADKAEKASASAACSSADKEAKPTTSKASQEPKSATASSSESETRKKRSIDEVAGGKTSKVAPLAAAAVVLDNGATTSKKPKSVQEDPNASDVYKSLFTSCAKAKNQQKAHWVTFNPQYF